MSALKSAKRYHKSNFGILLCVHLLPSCMWCWRECKASAQKFHSRRFGDISFLVGRDWLGDASSETVRDYDEDLAQDSDSGWWTKQTDMLSQRKEGGTFGLDVDMSKREDVRMMSRFLRWATDRLCFKSLRWKRWEEEQMWSRRNIMNLVLDIAVGRIMAPTSKMFTS